MSDGAREWPLAVFTVSIQFACGLALAATFSDCSAASRLATTTPEVALRVFAVPLGVAVFPVVVFGLFASLAHLGRPFAAWRSLLNLRESRLSHEVLITAVFAAVALDYGIVSLTGNSGMRLLLGIATSVIGLAAVGSSALLYAIPSQPFWKSGWLPASFFGVTLLLGSLAATALTPNMNALPVLISAIIAGSLMLLTSALWMLKHFAELRRVQLSSAQPEQPAGRLHIGHASAIVLSLVLSVLGPLAFAVSVWRGSGAFAVGPRHSPEVLLAAVVGALLGRMLMYSLPASLFRF